MKQMGKTIKPHEGGSLSKPIEGSNQKHPPSSVSFLSDIPVRGTVILGRTTITIRSLLALDVGSVVELDRPVGEGLDFVVNGAPFAKVDVTVIEDTYGLRVAEILNPFEL